MQFFHQTRSCFLQTLVKKYRVFSPMPRFQELPINFGRAIFATSYLSAEREDPKVHKPGSSTWYSRKRDENKRKERTRKEGFLPQAYNMFAAGAAKKRSVISGEEEQPVISTKKEVHFPPPENPLSLEEWEELKGKYDGYQIFEVFMLLQMIDYNRPIDVAKSLLAAVAKRDGDIHYNILLQYLHLCVSQQQTKEIYDMFDIMRMKFKTLEKSASTLLIKGLSDSPHWRDALTVLQQIKKQKVMTPTSRNYRDCIKAAIMNQEINLAWKLFHELLAEGLTPTMDTLQLFFDTGKSVQNDRWTNELIYILRYLRDNQIYPGEDLVHSIKQWFESIPGEKWQGNITTIKKSGQCLSCNQTLESLQLTPEEYNILKEKIMKDVIEGADTFRKTTPEELEQFRKFVDRHSPFDIVIDGLNVAKTSVRFNSSEILLEVVDCLAQQNLRLLVLGRKHMLSGTSQWKKKNMAAMSRKATFFFTENESEDDPFLIYAALHSGRHCKFITRDLLRDHKACVSDSLIQHLFFKWQRSHQMVLSVYVPKEIVRFEPVMTYDTIVQTTGDSWHIPYDERLEERTSYEVPTKWLCLRKK
ncbi:mitochondrial ribonuclease P catalytic subunit [Pogona vitticeps]